MASPKDTQLLQIKSLRWKARTDLMYLAQIIFGEAFELTEATHRPIINHFQTFPSPDAKQFWENDKYENGKWVYKPVLTLNELAEGNAETPKSLLLDSRGFAKSSINLVCHSVQWIINYPNIAMLIMQANLDKVCAVVKEIKSTFQHNEHFRALFPEHCPGGRVDDWGTQTKFTTEARTDKRRKEPTITGLSLGAGVAGLHFHVMKFSDIVEADNSTTPEQCEKVVAGYDMCKNLLDKPSYWTDVEGTRYDLSDLYGKIIDSEEKSAQEGQKRTYRIFARGCYKKDVSVLGYDTPKYVPIELDCPDLLDARGLPVSNWPEKFTSEMLERERLDKISPDSEIRFAMQRRNDPLGAKDVARTFTPDKFTVMSRSNYLKVPISYRTVTVDTASTQKVRSNYTAITTGAWSHEGKLYIEDIIHGKFLPEEIVFHLFAIHRRYDTHLKPQMYFLEKTMYVDGLMPTINRAQDTGKLYIPDSLREKYGKEWNVGNIRLPITLIPRETTVRKQDRIRMTLQVPYSTGELIFLNDIPCLDYCKQEFFKFPQFHTDDIIDTVADQYAQKEYFGRLVARPSKTQIMQQTIDQFFGVEDAFSPFNQGGYNIPSPFDPMDRTGL